MLIDAFTFFNEYDLLEIRLNELDQYVDYFVIATADKTHSGKENPYTLDLNEEKYKKFCNKCIHLEVKLPEIQNGNRWALENVQRNGLLLGIRQAQASIISGPEVVMVLVGDIDEFPHLKSWNGQEGVFRGPQYYYKMNKRHPHLWNGTVAVSGHRFVSPYGAITPQDVRNFRDLLVPCGTGKHFSWLGDPQEKVKSFAHSELDTPNFKVNQDKHPADGTTLVTVPITADYPDFFRNNIHRFKHLVA